MIGFIDRAAFTGGSGLWRLHPFVMRRSMLVFYDPAPPRTVPQGSPITGALRAFARHEYGATLRRPVRVPVADILSVRRLGTGWQLVYLDPGFNYARLSEADYDRLEWDWTGYAIAAFEDDLLLAWLPAENAPAGMEQDLKVAMPLARKRRDAAHERALLAEGRDA